VGTTESLIIAPQWIGDAVMTEPLLRRLRARGERLTVGALPWVAPVYRAMRAFNAGRKDAESLAPGREILCKTCDLVDHPNCGAGRLSPLPPSFQAAGITYAHGLDDHQARQLD
jgi:hypothetical protein